MGCRLEDYNNIIYDYVSVFQAGVLLNRVQQIRRAVRALVRINIHKGYLECSSNNGGMSRD